MLRTSERLRDRGPSRWTRRQWLRMAAAGIGFQSASGWIEALAAQAASDPQLRRACILLWMTGGPSQMDTFDLKPGHANGGPFKAIDTAAPGVKISEHLPQLAKEMKDVVPIRSMSTKEGDHGRATFFLRTGYMPQGPVQFPSLGSLVAKELEREGADLPGFVSIAPFRFFNPAAFGPGFLGPRYAPLVVGEQGLNFTGLPGQVDYEKALKVKDLDPPRGVNLGRSDARLALLGGLEDDFLASHPGGPAEGHRMAYLRAVKMMRSEAVRAFDLDAEPAKLRDAYGRNQFGQGCLLARRLVERGVPFVEVTLSGVDGNNAIAWDTHAQNFATVTRLSQVLDRAWATLMRDLRARGLLDSTLIVWMGEFGRTPKINPQGGRDHFPNAWTTVLAGGGIKGGQAVGRTSPDGTRVVDREVSVPDFMATICQALGIDPKKQNMSDAGRPIRIASPEAKPIREILA